MKVECLKFNTYYEDSQDIEQRINECIEGEEVIDIKITSTNYEIEDEMLLFVTILYK